MEERDPEVVAAENVMFYHSRQELGEVVERYPFSKIIHIDYRKLQAGGPHGLKLADKLLADPRYTFGVFETALYEYAIRFKGKDVADKIIRDIKFRFTHLPVKKQIRLIRASDVNQFISFEGVCRMSSMVKPRITTALFRCSHCGNIVRQIQRSRKLEYPEVAECVSCHNSTKWVHEIDRDVLNNIQVLTVQEFHEGLKSSEQPYYIDVELSDDICGIVNAGYRITVNGILKVIEGRGRTLVVDTIVDANSIELGDQSYTDVEISDEEISRIRELSVKPNVHELLAGAIAPSIYGHHIVKTAMVLQLFGGVTRVEKSSRIRGDIHMLLLGDPGIAKSQLLDFMSLVSPRGVKAMGGQSSNAGLTCAAKQDATGNWALEGGALVIADGGLCCIDEFEKMNKDDRAAIHGAMEQQKIDVNKAGINATLLTRCSILAAANPKAGRWDMFKNLTEQIDLPASLLSRFDLIFILRDVPDGRVDDRIAEHILEGGDTSQGITIDFLRKYIAYSRREISPERSKEANAVIKEYYLRLRGLSKDGAVPITPRKLEDLKRLSEASARVRLSKTVEEIDAKIAVQLIDACLRDVAYDVRTGKFDIDKVICNTSSVQRQHIGIVKNALQCAESHMKRAELYLACMNYLNKQEVDIALDKMQENCWISISRDDMVKLL
jgi:replicative DNA helicase Mcm